MKRFVNRNSIKFISVILWILFNFGILLAQTGHNHPEIIDSAGFIISSSEGVCYRYNPFLAWNFGISDFIIFLCYVLIPLGMLEALRALPRGLVKPLRNYSILLGFFIVTCGLTHLVKVSLFFGPIWEIAVFINWLCAIASVIAAIYLWIYTRDVLKNIAINLREVLSVKDSLKRLDNLEHLVESQGNYDNLTISSIRRQIELIRLNMTTLQSFQESLKNKINNKNNTQ